MSWTKAQIASEAYAELRLAGYEFDISPEEQMTAVRRLDALIATWESSGLSMGYNFAPNYADMDPGAESGLADSDIEAAYLNLAIRIAATVGKQLAPDTRKAARDSLDAIRKRAAMPLQQQLQRTLPRGAGNKSLGGIVSPFFPAPDTSPLAVDPAGLTIKDLS